MIYLDIVDNISQSIDKDEYQIYKYLVRHVDSLKYIFH
jgi:hypothetical protein